MRRIWKVNSSSWDLPVGRRLNVAIGMLRSPKGPKWLYGEYLTYPGQNSNSYYIWNPYFLLYRYLNPPKVGKIMAQYP